MSDFESSVLSSDGSAADSLLKNEDERMEKMKRLIYFLSFSLVLSVLIILVLVIMVTFQFSSGIKKEKRISKTTESYSYPFISNNFETKISGNVGLPKQITGPISIFSEGNPLSQVMLILGDERDMLVFDLSYKVYCCPIQSVRRRDNFFGCNFVGNGDMLYPGKSAADVKAEIAALLLGQLQDKGIYQEWEVDGESESRPRTSLCKEGMEPAIDFISIKEKPDEEVSFSCEGVCRPSSIEKFMANNPELRNEDIDVVEKITKTYMQTCDEYRTNANIVSRSTNKVFSIMQKITNEFCDEALKVDGDTSLENKKLTMTSFCRGGKAVCDFNAKSVSEK